MERSEIRQQLFREYTIPNEIDFERHLLPARPARSKNP